MRIKSKYKDYYDSAMSYGQDQSLLYLRTEKTKKLDKYPFPKIYASWFELSPPSNFSFQQGVVGFCGKIYPFLKITEILNNFGFSKEKTKFQTIASTIKHYWYGSPYEMSVKHCYTLQDFLYFVDVCLEGKEVDKLYKKTPKNKVEHAFSEIEKKQNDFQQYFTYEDDEGNKFPYPIFTCMYTGEHHECNLEYNSLLKQFEFYKKFDAWSAYMELQMYMSNLAIPMNPIPYVSDDDILIAKGFDKFSFKKQSSKNK